MNTQEIITIPFDIPEEYSQYDNSKFHVTCIPYAETVTYIKGTENGPQAIINASSQVEFYDKKTESEPYLQGISISHINAKQKIETIIEDTKQDIRNCLNKNKFPVILGGEHSISEGGILACYEKTKDLTILHIDAHADLREQYMGDKYNHACALKHSFDRNIQIVQVGIRSLTIDEHALIKNNPHKITTFFGDTQQYNIQEIINSIKNPNVYITIDLDGLDPSIMPAVGTPEPGGLNWFDLIEILNQTFKKFNVLAADIVELAPNKNSTSSDFTAAKLLYKLFSFKNKT